jgi:hypothetical protein
VEIVKFLIAEWPLSLKRAERLFPEPGRPSRKSRIKGIVQPFELGGEPTLIRSAVKYWKAGMF